ncbi:hypothetical protein BJ875DRAFT_465308 [Amylocarpus encephaloides]|uniref:Uncharacterized protein n=1 Tax=Amylocarpus encephaloides TaxID=45428 RepID=A0A9P7YG25_9HELO|nr:hypothetical protein BJ875DRAFT_465308 [Amylocarpus encephaloides]
MAPKLESGAPVRKRRSRFMPQFMVTAAVLQALVTIAGAFVGGRGLLRMDIFLTVRTMDKRQRPARVDDLQYAQANRAQDL